MGGYTPHTHPPVATALNRDRRIVEDLCTVRYSSTSKKVFYFVALMFAGLPDYHSLTEYDHPDSFLFGIDFFVTLQRFDFGGSGLAFFL